MRGKRGLMTNVLGNMSSKLERYRLMDSAMKAWILRAQQGIPCVTRKHHEPKSGKTMDPELKVGLMDSAINSWTLRTQQGA